MAEFLDVSFRVLVFITVVLTAVAIGLVTSVEQIRSALRRRTFLAVVMINIVVVPFVGYLLAQSFPLETSLETAIVLAAICAGGPLGLKVSQLAKGDMSWTLSLVVVLLLLNIVTLPLWTSVLLEEPLSLGPVDLMGSLVVAIALPVLIGAWLKRRNPASSRRWYETATKASNVLLVVVVAVAVAANFQALVDAVASSMLLASTVVLAFAGLMGWMMRGELSRRRPAALITLNRASSVALLVASRAFPDNGEIFTAVVVFGAVQTAIAVGLSAYWGRTQAETVAATA